MCTSGSRGSRLRIVLAVDGMDEEANDFLSTYPSRRSRDALAATEGFPYRRLLFGSGSGALIAPDHPVAWSGPGGFSRSPLATASGSLPLGMIIGVLHAALPIGSSIYFRRSMPGV
jgi:hypothetical protein